MRRAAEDFLKEARALALLAAPLEDADFAAPTQFKGWTIGDVIAHLAFFDRAAVLSATSEECFESFTAPALTALKRGEPLTGAQNEWLAGDMGGVSGVALRDLWSEGAARLAETFAGIDPKRRLRWLGPDMSARSFITARQMEVWAHAQAVFDALGEAREECDRVRNIC
ncbi:MAG: maleylpyruvate isomerase family mycothiol-dependent enzyme, partial [Pikeienuella sp.]